MCHPDCLRDKCASQSPDYAYPCLAAGIALVLGRRCRIASGPSTGGWWQREASATALTWAITV